MKMQHAYCHQQSSDFGKGFGVVRLPAGTVFRNNPFEASRAHFRAIPGHVRPLSRQNAVSVAHVVGEFPAKWEIELYLSLLGQSVEQVGVISQHFIHGVTKSWPNAGFFQVLSNCFRHHAGNTPACAFCIDTKFFKRMFVDLSCEFFEFH